MISFSFIIIIIAAATTTIIITHTRYVNILCNLILKKYHIIDFIEMICLYILLLYFLVF
jgi:hypothetical protein